MTVVLQQPATGVNGCTVYGKRRQLYARFVQKPVVPIVDYEDYDDFRYTYLFGPRLYHATKLDRELEELAKTIAEEQARKRRATLITAIGKRIDFTAVQIRKAFDKAGVKVVVFKELASDTTTPNHELTAEVYPIKPGDEENLLRLLMNADENTIIVAVVKEIDLKEMDPRLLDYSDYVVETRDITPEEVSELVRIIIYNKLRVKPEEPVKIKVDGGEVVVDTIYLNPVIGGTPATDILARIAVESLAMTPYRNVTDVVYDIVKEFIDDVRLDLRLAEKDIDPEAIAQRIARELAADQRTGLDKLVCRTDMDFAGVVDLAVNTTLLASALMIIEDVFGYRVEGNKLIIDTRTYKTPNADLVEISQMIKRGRLELEVITDDPKLEELLKMTANYEHSVAASILIVMLYAYEKVKKSRFFHKLAKRVYRNHFAKLLGFECEERYAAIVVDVDVSRGFKYFAEKYSSLISTLGF